MLIMLTTLFLAPYSLLALPVLIIVLGKWLRLDPIADFINKNKLPGCSSNDFRKRIPPFFINRDDMVDNLNGVKLPYSSKGSTGLYIFNYEFTQMRSFAKRYTIAAANVEVNFPPIFLDAHTNKSPGFSYEDFQKINLEGDFADYFTLYVERNSHIDGMSIITPDLMEKVRWKGKAYDVAIWQNNIAVIARGDHLTYKKLPDLISFTENLIPELVHKAKTWRSLTDQRLIFDDSKLGKTSLQPHSSQ